jgi:flagellar hook-associated protein 2
MSTLPSVNLNNLYAAFGSTGGGIDVTSAVSQILDADRACERQWQSQQQLISLQVSALNQLQSGASSLSDSLDALQDPTGALLATNISSTQPGIVSATAAAGTAAGTHIVVVQNLATTASWYSDVVATSTSPFTAASFDLTVGSGSSQTTTTIALGNGVNTPADLVKYINGLNLGVTASSVTDANGVRVALVSNNSGSATDFNIQPTPGTSSSSLFTRASTGANTSITVDGVPISSATNTVTGVINGVTLSLNGQAPGSEVVLTVGPDSSSAAQAVNAFVSAYNNLVGQVSSQFAYDSTNQTSGPLSSDSTVRLLQSSLLAAPSYSAGSGSITSLAGLGITMNDDGTLSVDSSTLNAAIQNNSGAVQAFFQGSSINGFAANLKSDLSTFSDPSQGAFTVDLQSLNNENNDLQGQVNDYEDYLSTVQTNLTNEYNQANILLLQLPEQQKQIDAMLGNNSNGSNS